MLCAHTMPRPGNAALQERERGLDGIRVDVAVHVGAILVLDRLVLRKYYGIMQSFRIAVKFGQS